MQGRLLACCPIALAPVISIFDVVLEVVAHEWVDFSQHVLFPCNLKAVLQGLGDGQRAGVQAGAQGLILDPEWPSRHTGITPVGTTALPLIVYFFSPLL